MNNILTLSLRDVIENTFFDNNVAIFYFLIIMEIASVIQPRNDKHEQ